MAPPSTAIAVEGLAKTFEIPREQVHTFKERALHPFRQRGSDTLRALRDVSFEVPQGEFFGIVGRNGSGKSTLLKCLAGIYRADRGEIYVNGRMSTFIELGVGFNMDLAARDNILINATMLGLSNREARRRVDQILDFAELDDFVDLKLKNYSSGMLVRLAFSVMIQVDADILLIDEVLAVGDAAFQQKCFDEFARIRRSGATVLLVTHDMTSVRRFCDRAMLLEKGHIVEIGDPERVGTRYLDLNFSREARAAEAAAHEDEPAVEPPSEVEAEPEVEEEAEATNSDGTIPNARYGDRSAEIVEAWFEDERGQRTEFLPIGRPAAYAVRVDFHEDAEDPIVGIELYNDQGLKLFGTNNVEDEGPGRFAAGESMVFRVRFDAIFAPGRYYFTPAIAHRGDRSNMDRREWFSSTVIAGARTGDWLVEPHHELSIESAAESRREALS